LSFPTASPERVTPIFCHWTRFNDEVDVARQRWRCLTELPAQRLVAAYGSRLQAVLGDAKDRAELGPAFGPELTGAEVRYLMAKEWARFPDDVLWRRSKLGLTMPPGDREALAAFMAASVYVRADYAEPGIPEGSRAAWRTAWMMISFSVTS
jgi:glycerol-3-phosphate dehydrogenase